jgi:hypothetical protein
VIWIAWRFQRSVVCALALLALVIIGFTVFVGTAQHHDLFELMSPPCRGSQIATPGRGDYCGVLAVKLDNAAQFDPYIRWAGFVIAPLVGAILGLLALASEVESRTVRLAWTQSISRTRWFVAKAGVGAALVAVILVPTAIVFSWWSGTIGATSLFGRETYGIAGWDLFAYGLFMFALTLFLGALIRRVGWTLPASVLVFLVIAVTFPSAVRQHLVTPTVLWVPATAATKGNAAVYGESVYPAYIQENAWILVNGVARRSTVGVPTWKQVNAISTQVYSCVNTYPQKTQRDIVNAEGKCYQKFGVENVEVYISDDQFWTMQLREGILYLSAGLILAGGALVLLRRIEP